MNKSSVKNVRSPAKAARGSTPKSVKSVSKSPARAASAPAKAARSAVKSASRSSARISAKPASKPVSKPAKVVAKVAKSPVARSPVVKAPAPKAPVAKAPVAKVAAVKNSVPAKATVTKSATPTKKPSRSVQSIAEALRAMKLAHAIPTQQRIVVSPTTQPEQMTSQNQTHKFQVGQTVYYNAPTFGRAPAPGNFTVVKILPSEGDEHQYRIKSNGEAFERVAKESQLDVT